MDKTITIRIDSQKDKALTRRAKQHGKTKSDFVRQLIDKALAPDPLGRRVGHLAGSIELPAAKSPLQRRLRERNWRD
jgi:plasmid stability protein